MDPAIEVLAVAMQDHRRSLDSRMATGPRHRASDIGTGTLSSSLSTSLTSSLFGMSPRPSGTFMRAPSLDRTSSNTLESAASLSRPSYTGGSEDFESLVSGYALRVPSVSAPVPIKAPGKQAPGSGRSILTHALSLPLNSGGSYASAMASPVVGRTQAKASGDISMYWDSMYHE